MTIEKAKEFSNLVLTRLNPALFPYEKDAIRLGVEALEREINQRLVQKSEHPWLLPSETKE